MILGLLTGRALLVFLRYDLVVRNGQLFVSELVPLGPQFTGGQAKMAQARI